MSTLGGPGRADARRNAQRILDATAELIAENPGASLDQIARRAGLSRATLYHHFAGRDALLDALTARSVTEVRAALEAARLHEGPPAAALERVLLAAWEVIGHYRGLVIINPQRLERSDLRARLAPALELVHGLIVRGQAGGAFDRQLGADWLLSILLDLIHGASRQVTAGTMDAATAERALLRTARAVMGVPA